MHVSLHIYMLRVRVCACVRMYACACCACAGNFLDGSIPKKSSQGSGGYPRFGALALEAQHFPDTVHHEGDPRWPSVVTRAGHLYRQSTAYRFYRYR